MYSVHCRYTSVGLSSPTQTEIIARDNWYKGGKEGRMWCMYWRREREDTVHTFVLVLRVLALCATVQEREPIEEKSGLILFLPFVVRSTSTCSRAALLYWEMANHHTPHMWYVETCREYRARQRLFICIKLFLMHQEIIIYTTYTVAIYSTLVWSVLCASVCFILLYSYSRLKIDQIILLQLFFHNQSDLISLPLHPQCALLLLLLALGKGTSSLSQKAIKKRKHTQTQRTHSLSLFDPETEFAKGRRQQKTDPLSILHSIFVH